MFYLILKKYPAHNIYCCSITGPKMQTQNTRGWVEQTQDLFKLKCAAYKTPKNSLPNTEGEQTGPEPQGPQTANGPTQRTATETPMNTRWRDSDKQVGTGRRGTREPVNTSRQSDGTGEAEGETQGHMTANWKQERLLKPGRRSFCAVWRRSSFQSDF